ncbi:DUF1491 family protein [Mesorhizobium sp. BH1-1-5]|uniref:DUF1491 family protein n=1 Tax=unclassified Mesorhizobium TaxID=325217 RepID=UPI0011294BD3|nr:MULTISPECIES: DUF1491 family protein [unclassified Mesorhizobium]MBZ9990435.1 DUF1491 family protein [Mesorhizobium sp. BH1-1-5]TPJ57360.1 DUF1491 family protein [Mesorhizobium sp. B2-7-1]
MRVTTDLWVSALVRRVFGAGGFAAVVKRGATEAGAVFVLSRGRMGEVVLYGPAPQTSYDSAKPDERFFGVLGTSDDGSSFDARLEREKKFDPDIWVVEIEGGTVPVEELLSVKAE